MKIIRYNIEKNHKLNQERGVNFEMVLFAIQKEQVLDDLSHPNQEKYPNQRLLIVKIKDYAYLIPYIESEAEIFLKTIIPSRKATKKYLGK